MGFRRWRVYTVLVTDPDLPDVGNVTVEVTRCWTRTWASARATMHGPDGVLIVPSERAAFGYTLADETDRGRFEDALIAKAKR